MSYGYCEKTNCNNTLESDSNGFHCSSCLRKSEIERAMYNLKHDLANSLQTLKKFDVGYTSKTNKAIAVEHDDRVFILRFEETPHTLGGAVKYL